MRPCCRGDDQVCLPVKSGNVEHNLKVHWRVRMWGDASGFELHIRGIQTVDKAAACSSVYKLLARSPPPRSDGLLRLGAAPRLR